MNLQEGEESKQALQEQVFQQQEKIEGQQAQLTEVEELCVFFPSHRDDLGFLHFLFRLTQLWHDVELKIYRKAASAAEHAELETAQCELQHLRQAFDQGSRQFKALQSRASAAESRAHAADTEVARLRRMLDMPPYQG